jgi:hypothetical protein
MDIERSESVRQEVPISADCRIQYGKEFITLAIRWQIILLSLYY